MQVIRLNTKEKAEKIIRSNTGKRRMHWERNYYTAPDGGLGVEYLIFYYPLKEGAICPT